MPDEANSTVRWPLFLLAPIGATLVLAVIGQLNAKANIAADRCVTGWQVPTGPALAVLSAVTLIFAVIGFAQSRRSRGSRSIAATILVVGIVVVLAALALHSAPYGWNCG